MRMTCWKRQNYSDGEKMSGCQGLGVTTKEENEEVLWVKTVLYPNCSGYMNYICVTTYRIAHPKRQFYCILIKKTEHVETTNIVGMRPTLSSSNFWQFSYAQKANGVHTPH